MSRRDTCSVYLYKMSKYVRPANPPLLAGPYDLGGVLTSNNRDLVNGETVQRRNQAEKEMHW